MTLEIPVDVRVFNLALALVALEGGLFIIWRFTTHSGPALTSMIANLLSGAFLLLVSREILVGASSLAILSAMAGALMSHVLDAALRWKAGARSENSDGAI